MLATTLAIAAVCASAIAALWFGQERLLFAPVVLPADHRFALGADVHETWVDVPGAQLNALHLRLAAPAGVVFFLHGNGGNLQSWFVNADFYRRANFDLFMIDYRGYGKSSGRVESEAQLHADVRAAWDSIAPQYNGYNGTTGDAGNVRKKRVVYGRSLGTGLAAALAADLQPELTVLVSPYENMQALTADHYPGVPAALLRYRLRTDEALARIKTPVLLVHGDADTLIAPAHSERLLARAPHAQRLLVAGAGHNDLQQFPAYVDGLAAALR